MKSFSAHVIVYSIYGVVAACLSFLIMPPFFSHAAISFLVFAALMGGGMFACNWLELKAWDSLTETQTANPLWRAAVRLCIYLGVPALLVWLTAFTGVFVLKSGFVSALGATLLPLLVASYLNIFPARTR